MDRAADFFISYTSADQAWADLLHSNSTANIGLLGSVFLTAPTRAECWLITLW
jgi:hypothetical protein